MFITFGKMGVCYLSAKFVAASEKRDYIVAERIPGTTVLSVNFVAEPVKGCYTIRFSGSSIKFSATRLIKVFGLLGKKIHFTEVKSKPGYFNGDIERGMA